MESLRGAAWEPAQKGGAVWVPLGHPLAGESPCWVNSFPLLEKPLSSPRNESGVNGASANHIPVEPTFHSPQL